MAAIRCKATRDGDHYVLNGQKTWSTRAVWADWLFGLFRSDPASQRHHGLTFLLLPLKSKGITIRPIRQLNGMTGFAEIFFDDVRVPVDNRLGEEGAGLEHRHGHRRLRARADAALAGPLPADGAGAGRAVSASTRTRPTPIPRSATPC